MNIECSKDLEIALNRGVTELEEAYFYMVARDRQKRLYIEKVTQSLRLPLTNLNLYLKLLKDGRPEKKDHYILIMEEQLAELSEIVMKMVAFVERDQFLGKEDILLGDPMQNGRAQKREDRLATF